MNPLRIAVPMVFTALALAFATTSRAQEGSEEGIAKENADTPATQPAREMAPGSARVQVLKLERPAFVESPKAVNLKSKQSKRKTGWLELEAEWMWETKSQKPEDQFSSGITVKYYVWLNNASKESPKPTILTGETKYEHVQAGSPVRSVMYVSPRALEYLFGAKVPASAPSAIVNFGVVVSGAGEEQAGLLSGSPKAPFWEDPKAKAGADFRDGMLMRKSQTPFANEAWDYYEQEKLED